MNPLNLGAKRYDIHLYLPSTKTNAIIRPNFLPNLACFNVKFGSDYYPSLHPLRCHSRQLRLKRPHPRACSSVLPCTPTATSQSILLLMASHVSSIGMLEC